MTRLSQLPTCRGSSHAPRSIPTFHLSPRPFFFFFCEGKKQCWASIGRGGGWRGQMSSKNLVSASQAASSFAPFIEPSRKETAIEGAPGGRRARLLASRQKKKC